ncbi:MAG TPA: DUF58 domain-containing protein [Candidatus Limnocylindria bacterium]|jgi:uncharacterized protein (DUF58 family)|nr:DUF58 domain-containing protein [Candidatus Limnocylindria bacterium]
MIPADWLKRLRRVEVRARLVSEQLMGGRMGSVFKGRGMDFADVREYVPGDDVRRIDWNVTARLRRPYIKRHVEERELVVMLLVDGSASGHFGTAADELVQQNKGEATKRELAATVAGSLAFSAVREGDRVGLIYFTDRVERYVPPRKTRQHVTRLLHELLFIEPKSQGTSITGGLQFLNNLLRRPALVFVLSDFLDPDQASWERTIKAANQRHEIMAVRLTDQRESELPAVGVALVQDAETGEIMEIDTDDPVVRAAWADLGERRRQHLVGLFRSGRIPSIELRTDEPWPERLQLFLDHAAKRRVA